MHIFAHGPQVASAAPVDDQGFVAATEQVPESPVPPVESCGVDAQKPLHSSHQMKMIAHQIIGMDLTSSLQAGLGQCFKEPFPIRVILKNRLLPITAVHDMIKRSWVLEPKFSGHASHPTQSGELLLITWSDPFTLSHTWTRSATSHFRF